MPECLYTGQYPLRLNEFAIDLVERDVIGVPIILSLVYPTFRTLPLLSRLAS